MKTLLLPIILLLFSFTALEDFYQKQLSFPRVQHALHEKGAYVKQLLISGNINPEKFDIFLRAFKKEKTLEVWAKNKENASFIHLKDYDFCESSGKPGPKRRSGDLQTPEGFYKIDAFNPTSEFYLSFRVNYPNQSDLKFADSENPGGDIYIHGKCVTVGCIPLGDDAIMELYLLVIKAKAGGQDIPVHIFPAKLSDQNFASLKNEYAGQPQLTEFWSWLKPGHDFFEKYHRIPEIIIDQKGRYLVKNSR